MSVTQLAGLLETMHADRSEWVYGHAGTDDADILRRDAGVTTHQANNRPGLLAVARAKGVRVYDFSDRGYLDLHGNNCHHIGYGHPKLIAALTRQLSTLACNVRGFTNGQFVRFAEKLAAAWPGRDGRVFMVPGGAAAVELALAIARVHTGRHKSVTFADSFHGRSFGAASLSGAKAHRSDRLGPLLPGSLYLPSFRPGHDGSHTVQEAATCSLQAARRLFDAEPGIACFLAEPMALDAHRPPDWYWPAIRKLCDQKGVLLIFDEVPTGLGKMGSLFSSDLFGVIPDMTILGKALGGAALAAAAVIADGRLDTAPELNLGYFTHEKNPLLAQAALTTLEIIEQEQLVQAAGKTAGLALDHFLAVQNRFRSLIPNPARAQGCMLSFNMAGEGCTHEQNETLARSLFYCCIENGLILNYPASGTMLTLSFPLVISRDEIDEAFMKLDHSLSKINCLLFS